MLEPDGTGALLEEIPEGRHPDLKLKPKGGSVHACRIGTSVLLVATQIKGVLLFGNVKTSKRAVETLFDAFEEATR